MRTQRTSAEWYQSSAYFAAHLLAYGPGSATTLSYTRALMTESPTAKAAQRTGISTAIFAAGTFASRLAGMARQMVVAAIFGSSSAYAAFTVASQIPNLVRSLVADSALSAAFVPVFARMDELDEKERAWRLASSFVSLILLILGPITILTMVGAPWIVGLLIGDQNFSSETVQLTIDLTRILMPIVVLMGLSGLVVGILNAYGHFTAPALAPIAWNAVILLGLLALTPFVSDDAKIYVYAGSVLVGTVVQFAIPLPWLRGLGGKLRFGRSFRDPAIKEVLILMLPVTISLGLINIQQVIDTVFATRVPAQLFEDGLGADAGPAIMEYAFRLYMLPQGVFSVAVSTVFFPLLARKSARGDNEGFRDSFAEGLGQIFLLLIPSAMFLGVFSVAVTRTVYQYGAFGSAQTSAVAATLAMFSIGLVFNGASLLVIRALFSLQRPWLPTVVSLLTLAVNVGANFVFYDWLGLAGIALSTSIVNMVGFLALYLSLRRTVGLLHGRASARVVVLSALLSALAVAIAWVISWGLSKIIGDGQIATIVSLATAVLVISLVYGFGIVRMRLVAPALAARIPVLRSIHKT